MGRLQIQHLLIFIKANFNVTIFTLTVNYASLAVKSIFTNSNNYLKGFFLPLSVVQVKLHLQADFTYSLEIFYGCGQTLHSLAGIFVSAFQSK